MAKKKDAEVYYDVPALVVTPDKLPAITGNYEMIEKFLEKWKAKVTTMKLSEDNLDEVQAIKKAAVAFRNRLKDAVDDAKRRLFNDPKAVFDAKVKGLNSLLAEVEGAADNILDKIETQRVIDINQILDYYKKEFQEKYKLEETYLDRIEYKKDFYNKTTPKGFPSMDKYQKVSLEEQFKELKKEQSAYAANVRLIESACKDDQHLNSQHWVNQLKYDDVATIIEKIETEKKRLKGLTEINIDQTPDTIQEAETEVVNIDETKKMILGAPANFNFQSDFPGRETTINLQITYPCDLGDALTELFKSLKSYGIKIKKLEKEVVF
jgi:hypothetical protein